MTLLLGREVSRANVSMVNAGRVDAIFEMHKDMAKQTMSNEFASGINNRIYRTIQPNFLAQTDARARSNPKAFHHVYEWGEVGNRSRRLFETTKSVSGKTMVVGYNFRPSKTPVKSNSNHIFWNKAEVMEGQIPVTIRPKNKKVLAFQVDGQMVFTKGPVLVAHPGGRAVHKSFRNAFDAYFNENALNNNSVFLKMFASIEQRIAKEMDHVPSNVSEAKGRARRTATEVSK